MPRPFHRLLLAAVLLGFVTGAGAGEPVPDWWRRLAVRDLSGTPIEMTGRWTVIVFISPECPLANTSIPMLNALAAQFGPDGVRIVGAYADPTLDLAVLRRHAAEFHLAFAVADDRGQRLVRATGATYTPEAFVFSNQGALLYRGRIDDRVGGFGPARLVATQEDLRDVLKALAAGRPGPFTDRPGFGCALPEAVSK